MQLKQRSNVPNDCYWLFGPICHDHCVQMAGPQEQDVEVQFRALVAIGTLVSFSQMFWSLIFFHACLLTGIESMK